MLWLSLALVHGRYLGLGMMLWFPYKLVHGRYCGLGMDALVSVCARTWMKLVWSGQGRSCFRMR